MDDEMHTGSLGILSEDHLARRIKHEMDQRKWSQERLAAEMADAGHPLHQSAISKIIKPKGKRRTISVDEALGFAKVFETTLESLLLPPGAVRSREALHLMQRLDAVQKHQMKLMDEVIEIWGRLSDLLAEPEIVDLIAEQLEKQGSFGRGEAVSAMLAWWKDSAVRSNIVLLRQRATHPCNQLDWETVAYRYLHFLDEVLSFLDQLTKPNTAEADLRAFIEGNRENIEAFHIPSLLITALWERYERTGPIPPDDKQLDSALDWVHLHIAVLRTFGSASTDDAE